MPDENIAIPDHWDRNGLPGWAYSNAELYDAEMALLFRTHWQLVCHENDLTVPGAFMTFDLGGERALILRGEDNVLRAFHNLCRHRGSRVVEAERGVCKHVLTCPFHGWSFNLDGTLRGAAQPASFPQLDPVEWGLKAIEMEVWNGFVFIRFQPGPQPSLATLLARFDTEIAPYNLGNMERIDDDFVFAEADVNWKSMRDVDNEGYHVARAHPSLQDLYGKRYVDEPYHNGVARSLGQFNPTPSKLWSVRNYRALAAAMNHLPAPQNESWLYIALFPNTVIGLYPDSVIFYQDVPDGPKRTKQRGAVYRYRDESRLQRAARYLSGRIDGLTADEDLQLTKWTDEAPLSSGFDRIILSDLEYGVRSHHDHLRAIFPILDCDKEPESGHLKSLNDQLSSGTLTLADIAP